MCGFFFSKRELALIAAGAVVLSPLLLVGAAVYGAGVGIKAGAKAANRAHERRLLRHLNRANTSTASPIQQLWDAGRFSQDVFQRWRLAFALMAVGDLRAAHFQFTAAVNGQRSLTAKYFVPALYFLAMCEVRSQQWQMAITHLERALSKLEVSQTTEGGDATGHVTDEGATELSITVADLQGLLAFALVANAARAEVLDTASAEKAAGLAERAANLDLSNARHFATQGWALFLLGLRVHPDDGKTVTTDATLLQKALYAVQRARKVAADSERDAHAAIVAQFGDKATAALAATVTDEGVVVVGTVVDHKPVRGERPDDDTGSDDEEATSDAPLEAFATGQGAGGISIAELYSLQAQIHLALGDAEAAAAALAAARSIDVGVPHSGLSADPDVGDPRIGLLRPWPLFAIDTGAGLNNHTFVEAKLRKPTWCDYCMNFIPSTNCMRCTACGYTVHRPTSDCDCVEVAKNKECVCAREGDDVSDATPVTNHQHVLRFRRVHTSHDCVHCGKSILFMTRALECNVCRCFAHDKCAPLMTNAVVDRPNEGSAKYALRRW